MAKEKSKKKGLGFLVGAGIGAGVTALFTTKKGKEYQKKISELCEDIISKLKNLDADDVKDNIEKKVAEIKADLVDLDKEKAIDIVKEKAKVIQDKVSDLVDYAVEKGTPVIEESVENLRKEAIKVTKQILKKLENSKKED